MSAETGTARIGPLESESPAGRDGARDLAGALLGRLTLLPALLSMAWLLAGLPLLLAGHFTPLLMLVLSAPLAVVLVVLGLRWIPDRWQSALVSPGPGRTRTPWWALAGVIAVAVAFGADQWIYHSQDIIVMRDPAAYFQFGNWIASHGSLPIPQSQAAFGGTYPWLTSGSPGFYQVGAAIVPQFMAGLPMVLAAAFWAGGAPAAAGMGALLGAGAVLAFGGLAARLVGPRWALFATAVLAVCEPQQYTSRETFSEPLAEILLFSGLCLVIDSLENDRVGARVMAALGGLALGLAILARIDGVSDILPVIPYAGLLLIGRRRQAVPLIGGLLAGALYGAVDGVGLSWPYLVNIKDSLIPLVAAAVLVVILTAVAVRVLRRRGLPNLNKTWVPTAAAALPFALMAFFAIRPYFDSYHPRAVDLRPTARAFAWSHPLMNWLFELSLRWVFWYVGIPMVVIGTVGAAVLARRCLQGRSLGWGLPFLVFAWAIVTVLYRPAIMPEQPWASRRLVPGVLPGLILLAVWATSWMAAKVRENGYHRVASGGAAALCAAALLAPPAATTFGLKIHSGGPLGIRLATHSMAFRTKFRGEIAAIHHLCAAIPSDASVVAVDPRIGRQYTQVVRGTCHVPTAWMGSNPDPSHVAAVVRGIRRAGRRPVFLAAFKSQLTPYGGTIQRVLWHHPRGDGDYLLSAPHGLATRVQIVVYVSEPAFPQGP